MFSVQFLSCESIRIYVRMLFLFILQKVCVRTKSIDIVCKNAKNYDLFFRCENA